MTHIYDFNTCSLSFKNGTYGGSAGDKDGVVIDGEEWLIKYPKSLKEFSGDLSPYSTSPLSEYVGSHTYKMLEFDVHRTELGIRNGKLVVACKDFASEDMLIEIRTIKNHTGRELSTLLEGSPMHSSETHIVDLDELLLHIDKNPILSSVEHIKDRFFEQAAVDIFINNNDRNNGNWGILRGRDHPDRLAPIFDNGSSFSSKLSERKIPGVLSNPNYERNTTNVLTAYGKDGHVYNARTFFEKVHDIPEFRTAIIRVSSLIEKHMNEIKAFISDIPEKIRYEGKTIDVITPARKELYIKQLDTRYEKLILPECERIREEKKKSEPARDDDIAR